MDIVLDPEKKRAIEIDLLETAMSYVQIAEKHGVTKGVVAGLKYRLKETSPLLVARGNGDGGLRRVKPKLVIVEPEPEVDDGAGPTILTVGGCRWPVGVANGVHRFCDAPKAGRSYCAAHTAVAYIPSKPKVKRFGFR